MTRQERTRQLRNRIVCATVIGGMYIMAAGCIGVNVLYEKTNTQPEYIICDVISSSVVDDETDVTVAMPNGTLHAYSMKEEVYNIEQVCFRTDDTTNYYSWEIVATK